MGLTIHYTLKSDVKTAPETRALVEKLHVYAGKVPFADVGEVVERQGVDDCDFNRFVGHDPHKWLLVQAAQVIRLVVDGKEQWRAVKPKHMIGFSIKPGEGCEQANIGLCRYPMALRIGGQHISTGLRGWRWSSFCKTQYASNPACGGIDNFLRCHLGVIQLLDYAAKLGILGEVKDESGYWEKRDKAALVEEINRWNATVAGAYGALKDAMQKTGGDAAVLEGEIAKFSNFEHLEAEGQREKDGQ